MSNLRKITEEACNAVRTLHDKGMYLPCYQQGRGKPFLYELLSGKKYDSLQMNGFEELYWHDIFAPYEAQLKTIASPHAWAFIKILLHRAETRRKREEKAKIRNKKARQRHQMAWDA